jgi:predicted hydrocarbon binding protein
MAADTLPPPRGDYFADDDYTRTDVAAGVARDRAGTRLVGLPEDFLTALHQTLTSECGPAGGRVLKAAGRDWGMRLAQRLSTELGEFRGEPLAEAPVARFQADLQSAFRHLGWGVLTLDFSKYDKGLLVAEIRYAPAGETADALLAGALGGLFSHFTGRELDAVGTPARGDVRRFVIALPERLDRVADALDRRRSHEEVIAVLEEVRV